MQDNERSAIKARLDELKREGDELRKEQEEIRREKESLRCERTALLDRLRYLDEAEAKKRKWFWIF